MLNPTCPNCQHTLTASAAWRESYTVMISLACECGYETVARVPNSRFNDKGECKMEFQVDGENGVVMVVNASSKEEVEKMLNETRPLPVGWVWVFDAQEDEKYWPDGAYWFHTEGN